MVRLDAAGWSNEEILADHPDLDGDDIRQALEYAAAASDVHYHALHEPA